MRQQLLLKVVRKGVMCKTRLEAQDPLIGMESFVA